MVRAVFLWHILDDGVLVGGISWMMVRLPSPQDAKKLVRTGIEGSGVRSIADGGCGDDFAGVGVDHGGKLCRRKRLAGGES